MAAESAIPQPLPYAPFLWRRPFPHVTRVLVGHGAEDTPGYELISAAIKAGSRFAIWLSTRL